MEAIQPGGRDTNIIFKGVTICCDDFGASDIPLIFIHGFPFDKSSGQPHMEFLKYTHRVLAYDIRGFGKSADGEENVGISLFADDLVELMDVLQIEKAVACGLSLGGYVLLNAVSRYSERFEAVILSDMQCIAGSNEGGQKQFKTVDQMNAEGLANFNESFVKDVFYPDSADAKKELVEKIREIILTTSSLSITGTLSTLAQCPDMCSSLNEILIPILILCGEEDNITPMTHAEFLNRSIVNSVFHNNEWSGYLSNLEQPEEFNHYHTSFIPQA